MTAPRPVPARITIALDTRGLYGPDVDTACGTWEGNPAGDVDAWEDGTAVPTAEQLVLLAKLTGQQVGWFLRPTPAGEQVAYVCDRSKRKHGLTIVTSRVDERGVLHRTYDQPSRRPP